MKALAAENFKALTKESYVGRGIALGFDEKNEHLVQVCWLAARTEPNRNRIFEEDDELKSVRSRLADPSLPRGDLSFILYRAMQEVHRRWYVVGNGDQTDLVMKSISQGLGLSLPKECIYENDPPIYTARITGLSVRIPRPRIFMHILRKDENSEKCLPGLYTYDGEDIPPGLGRCLTTYKCDGNPPPAFEGEPYLLPLCGDIEEICNAYYNALDADNRIAVTVKFIEIASGESHIKIKNKLDKDFED